jgi:hypothetical protein
MADNFNLRQFLTENKLTKNAQLLKEGSDYGYEAVIDAIADHFEEGTPEYDQVLAAVEDAFYNNQVDTSEFSHDLSAPGRVVLDIAAGLGLAEAKEEEDLDEAMPPANNMYSAHNFDGVAREAKKHKHLMKIANELFPQYGGDLENFKPLSPLERQQVYKQYTADTKVIPFKESKLTAKERKLVKLVENALGIQKEVADQYGYDPDNEEWEPEDDYPGQTRYVSRRDIEEGEEMVNEKPLPKYENIEKLMQEIEAGTNEAAHSYKMKRMKEIAEMLEAKVGTLEEGEGADFVDAKKVKQMKKDIMTLRKHAEKLEKEYDKKFAKKEVKKEEK